MQKNKFKKEQYEIRVRDELNEIIRTQVSDQRLRLVSVTRVEMNPDYSLAKCYWDTFDDKTRGDVKTALDGVAGKIRSILAKKLKVRHTPSLSFLYDAQFHSENEITGILAEEESKGRYNKED